MDNTIQTVEQAYAKLGKPMPDFNLIPGLHKSTIAHELLGTVIEAVNDGWVADFDNGDQRKYEPWFIKKKNGFVLYDVDDCYDFTYVSSRLCFVSREAAEHTVSHFNNLYQDLLNK